MYNSTQTHLGHYLVTIVGTFLVSVYVLNSLLEGVVSLNMQCSVNWYHFSHQ